MLDNEQFTENQQELGELPRWLVRNEHIVTVIVAVAIVLAVIYKFFISP